MTLRSAFIISGETAEERRTKGKEVVRKNSSLVCRAFIDTGFPNQYVLMFGDDADDFRQVDGNAFLFAATFRGELAEEPTPALPVSGLLHFGMR